MHGHSAMHMGICHEKEDSGQFMVDSGHHQHHPADQVVVVRSASTIMPCVDCGVVPHPGTEAGRRMLTIRSTDVHPVPRIEIMVHLINGQLHPSSASFSNSSSSSIWLPLPLSMTLVQSWMTFIRPARDRYEQNLALVRDPLGGLCLKTVRLIRPGEELLVWFSEELARSSGVPIISPVNITHDKEYFCTACRSCFRFPNTLKSHIMFDCRLPFTNLLLTRCRQFPPSCFSPWSASSRIPEVTLASGFPLLLNRACAESDRERCHGDKLPLPVMTSSSARERFLTSGCSAETLVIKRLPLLRRMFAAAADVSSGLDAIADWPAMMTSADDCPMKSKRPTPEPKVMDRVVSTELPVEVKEVVTPSVERETRKRAVRHHCSFCGKLYSRKYGLTIHLRTHSGYKPLKCRVCLRPFGDPSNLNKHVRLHGDGADTPYRCRYCGKVLVRRRDLDRHIRSRHPDVTDGVENVTNVTEVAL